MAGALPFVIAFPFAGFVILALAGARMSRRAVAAIGAGSVGLAAAAALATIPAWLAAPHRELVCTLWRWIEAGSLSTPIMLRLDALSLVMTGVVTGVGFLIHLYSIEYMRDDDGYARFFAAMNLFVAAMLVLVLADTLVLLLLGWEGVGLCSYLLIGFWYRDPANGRAARKAFVVTRIGDTAMLIGLLVLFDRLGTFAIPELMARAAARWPVGSPVAIAVAALLLAGAVGKSAQLPLQTWLPDAMAGPTPVSALIHAATMVTAGVYLIARTHVLFELAPPVQTAVAVVGVLTLLMASFAALAQHDIKRVLAYSTISQIGYMFLALGVGAWTAAIFHLVTHAFFKALLFLGAGAVIHAVDGEHDIFKMGGLARRMPLTFWTFTAASASLAGLPLVTAGFYSKDLILWRALSAPGIGPLLWAGGLVGAFLTAVYIFRVVFIAFVRPAAEPGRTLHRPGPWIGVPLVVLAVLALSAGLLEVPRTLGGVHLFSHLLSGVLPETVHEGSLGLEAGAQLAAAVVALAGVAVAWWAFGRRPESVAAPLGTAPRLRVFELWADGWGFDALYDRVVVRPLVRLSEAAKGDAIDAFAMSIAGLAVRLNRGLALTQDGRVRRALAVLAAGAVLVGVLAVLT